MLRMQQSRMILIVICCLMEHFCFGTPGDKGLVLGVWNPASFTTFTEIPKDSSSSFSNVTLSLMPSSVQITSMASDPKEAVIFASIKDTIYIYNNFSIWQNASPDFSIQFRGKSASLGQIAFDFVSQNLYWCDSLLHWIAMKPAYNFNHTIYKVIVHKDLNQPEGLALDPEDKLMFFSDNEPNCRIEKASLDGRNRVVIVHKGLSRVFSLTVDTTNNRLFWADHVRQTLESCSYDGTNRRVIRRMNSVAITGLTYFQNTLHVVSSVSKLMFGVDTTSGSVLYSRAFLSVQPFTILAYDAENPGSFNNPCLALRCEHMCINIQSGPKCVCSEGFQLNEDATTCIDRSWFYERGFIVSNASLFAMHEVHSTSGQSNEYYHLSVSGDIIGTFAVDSNSDILYYSDSISNSLKKLDLISQQASTIASISSAKDMMFDWIANLLGWIETSTSSIRSFSVDSQTNVAIYSSLQQPTSLTVNPYSGALYWISGVSMKSIFRGSWTKETPVILISSANLNNPSSLQYDVSSNRLYWLDITILKSALTNGTDIKSHIITSGATEIFVYKGFFGWISGNKIYFARKSATSTEDELNTVENSNDVALFDALLQQDRRGTCDILNGGCGEICIPEENGRRCECDVGLQLQTDQSCDREILLESFIVVIDYTHGRILQIDLQNGTVVKLPISINRAPGLVLDKSTMTLFYAEASSNTITSTTLHGQNSTLFYATGFAHADRLAIDYSTGNLYYTAVGPSTSQSYIGVLHRSTSLHKTLISNLHSPRDIALYPSKGYMFWTEFGNITEIGRTSMDGTSKIYIATTQIGWPNGLTIDFTSSRLYWTDGQNNRIESSDLNGGNRQVLATDSDAHLMSIVIHGQYLYYTAWNRQRITKMDKRTGSKVVFMSNHPELGRLDSLDIYGDESQDVSISCSNKNGFCSTFCFPTPTGRTCGCQDNVNIQSDQLTCEGVSRCPTVLQNLNFLDCQPYPGQSCNFECKTGYRLAINTSVSCGSSGQWNLQTDTLCEAILCPVSLGTAVLSTNCNRRIRDSCSFSCTDGYRPTTSTNLVCTSDGTWNMDTNTLCSPILCPVSFGTAVLSTNCSRSIGDSCSFFCTDGHRPTSTNLVCTTDGTWNVDTNTLCSPILCPVTLPKAVLSPNCSRRIGDSCPFSCTDGNLTATSTNVVCTTSGSWNLDTNTLCSGVLGAKGLILGVRNPASFTTITDIPKDSANPFRNATLQLYPSTSQITSLSSDTKKAVVFAAIGETIYIYHNFSIWQNVSAKFSVQFRGKSAAIGQIAFDFVSNNLYWCDSLLNWIAMKPAYNYNNTFYKVVVEQDLIQPEGLALDPVDRFMFFSDNNPNSRIEKASLDGQDRVVIVHKGLSRVLALTVDPDNNKLYWADFGRQTLEGCDYDGANRRVIRRMNSVSITGLTYFQNVLHGVSFGSRSMFAVNVVSGSMVYSRTFLSAQPFAITVYDTESLESLTDPCLTLNCQHICVNERSGPKCICYEGFILGSNNITCIDKSWIFERGFIVSNGSMFAMHEVHSASSDANKYNYRRIPNNIIETFAVDAISDIIYFVDSSSGSLKKHDIISRKTSTIASVSSARDLKFDWIAKILGWIEPSTSSIRSFSLNSQTSAMIYTSQYQPASLTIDPHNGALYWITGLSDRSIVRGSWTRVTPTVLISAANLNNPSSLQYDVTSHRLYWLDQTLIKSSKTNGSDIKSHIITNGATRAFVYKDFFGWINGDKLFFGRKTDISAIYELNTLKTLKDVAVFDSSLEKDKRGTCQILNGGCGELCVPEENGRRCECDIGLQLQPDQSCDSDVLTTGFIIVSDYTHGRIIQIDLHTGRVVKVPLSINKPPGIAFDKSTRTLFFSDLSTNTIMTTSLHGTNKTLFYTTGFAYADCLAIDYSTGNLYYTAVGPTTSQSYIGVVHRSTSLHKTLIYNLHSPRDIALYPSKGYMFWTELGIITEIGRTNMDGTSKIYIATTQIGWPNGLTIDFTSNRLYWTDGKRNRIESSNLNGGNRRVISTDNDAHLMSIVSHGQYLFYTAWNRQRITKINKLTGLKAVFMSNHPELGRLDSLDIYADEIQDVSLSCSSKNGFCSTFCFPTPTGRTCGCQDNVNLQADQLTCHGVSRCPTLLQKLNFLDCLPFPGHSCSFVCKTGYQSAINTSVFCGSSGQWNLPTDTLCEAILCPVSMNSVVLSPNCSRRIRDSCFFSCIDGYRPTTSTNLMCTADGTWNRDTNTLCSRTTPEEQTGNSAYVYAGLSAAGVVVLLVTVVIGIYCLKKRRDNSTRNPYEGHHISNESSGYTTFGNGGYDDYSTIEDIGDPNINKYQN